MANIICDVFRVSQ